MEWELDDSSQNIIVRNNRVSNLKCFTREHPVVVHDDKVVTDARGSVFQFIDPHRRISMALNRTDGTYKGNVVADAQIMTAKAILDGTLDSSGSNPSLLTNINTIPQSIVAWAEGIPFGSPPTKPKYTPSYRCHGDIMHHVIKGMVGIRMEET
jgi:hypothetical protein